MSESLLENLGLEELRRYTTKTYTMRDNDRVVAEVEKDKLPEVINLLKKKFGNEGFILSTIVGTDLPSENAIRVDYFINIIRLKKYLVIRVKLPRNNPRIKSLLALGINAALSGESETYDLLGINFEGNKYLRRGFFVPVEIANKGVYPLRKDAKV